MASRSIEQAFNFRKLMINVILLLSLTAFSGLHNSCTNGNQQKTKSELHYAYSSLAKKSVTYHTSLRLNGKLPFKPEHDLNQAVSIYNSSLQTKLTQLLSVTLLFDILLKLSFLSSVHQYPDEDSHASM